jgi:hypothetical protein
MLSRRIRALVLAVAAFGLLVVPVERSAASTLYLVLSCRPTGNQTLHCTASVGGGTGIYTYQWTPEPFVGSEGNVLIHCTWAYSYQTVYLTATDSNGATVSDSTVGYCGDAP